MVGDGRLAAFLELPAGDLRSLCFDYLPQQKRGVDAIRRRGDGRRATVLSDTEQFCGEPVQGAGGGWPGWSDELRHAAGWQRFECAAAISGNGDSSAELVLGLHRIYDSVCVCAGSAFGAVSRREVDSPDAQVDHDCVDVPVVWNFAWSALGLRGVGLGRLLGLGSGGERVSVAVADGNSVSALGDDAGKTRHDESVERVVGVYD